MSYDYICTACGKPCDTTTKNVSIGVTEFWGACSYHEDYIEVSECCEAEVEDNGGCIVRTSTHVARKNHVDRSGNVVIPAGRKYVKTYERDWYIDEDGRNIVKVSIRKVEVAA